MTTDIKEALIQATREWIRVVMGWTPQEAANLCIAAQRGGAKGPRRPVPFLVVDIVLLGRQIGKDEFEDGRDGDDNPVRRRKGERGAFIGIEGFGLETDSWIEYVMMHPHLAPSPLSPVIQGEILDLSELADTNIEARYRREFFSPYRIYTDPRPVDELETVITVVETPDETEVIIEMED